MKKTGGHRDVWFENTPSALFIRIWRRALTAVVSVLPRLFLRRENGPDFAQAKLRCLDVGNLYKRAELDCISCYHERRL